MKSKIIIAINILLGLLIIMQVYKLYNDNQIDTHYVSTEVDEEVTVSEEEYIQETSVIEITYSTKLLTVIDNTAEEWMEDIGTYVVGNYEDLYKNPDGSVTIIITEEQRGYWLNFYKDLVQKLQDDFNNIDEKYKIVCNEDYSQIDFYYNLDIDTSTSAYYILSTEAYCACVQIFNGIPSDEWYVEANIYNTNTGKLVANGSSETGLSYTIGDWK